MGNFHIEQLVIAKKRHKCCECNGHIYRGQEYTRRAGAYDGSGYAYKTCDHCMDTFRWLDAKLREGPYGLSQDDGIEFGGVEAELEEWLSMGSDLEAQRRLDEMKARSLDAISAQQQGEEG